MKQIKKTKVSSLSRKNFFKFAIGSLAVSLSSKGLVASSISKNSSFGLLYDSTKCIGCRACVSACQRSHSIVESSENLKSKDLSGNILTSIRIYRDAKSGTNHFIKAQCMHCVTPSCVSACPVSAMRKDPNTGIVYNDPSACMGCRYCMIACPFDIIRFEWDSAYPKIQKCDLCKETYFKEKSTTACTEICPVSAILFGTREHLISIAHERIKENPGKYFPKVYGEKDGGGTSILYLANTQFENLGMPKRLGDTSPAKDSENIQAVFSGMLAPIIAFLVLLFPVAHNYIKGVELEKKDKHDA